MTYKRENLEFKQHIQRLADTQPKEHSRRFRWEWLSLGLSALFGLVFFFLMFYTFVKGWMVTHDNVLWFAASLAFLYGVESALDSMSKTLDKFLEDE